ncbi:MAG: YfcE family phosphodiesterase [Treponema sp.]|nr:YfcE family phosphodiesterase [Treponema sp.]
MKTPTLLVISDTHGNVASLTSVLGWAKQRGIDALAFLGDGIADLSLAADRADFHPPWKLVRGNGDWQTNVPLACTMEFAGHTFYLSHGHVSHVEEGLALLIAQAKAVNAETALFGHTHVPFWDEIEGLLVLNPGSASRPRSSTGPSVATIACPPDAWFIVHYWNIREGWLGEKTIREMTL